MRPRFLILVALSWCAAVTAQAAPRLTLPAILFEKYVLPNGMQVILHLDKKLPLVHVNLWYHVGSKNEQRGHTGFAHLFEHMMLQGSLHAPEDYFSLMARAGAKGGRDSNGTTSYDRTNYFATAPSGSSIGKRSASASIFLRAVCASAHVAASKNASRVRASFRAYEIFSTAYSGVFTILTKEGPSKSAHAPPYGRRRSQFQDHETGESLWVSYSGSSSA